MGFFCCARDARLNCLLESQTDPTALALAASILGKVSHVRDGVEWRGLAVKVCIGPITEFVGSRPRGGWLDEKSCCISRARRAGGHLLGCLAA